MDNKDHTEETSRACLFFTLKNNSILRVFEILAPGGMILPGSGIAVVNFLRFRFGLVKHIFTAGKGDNFCIHNQNSNIFYMKIPAVAGSRIFIFCCGQLQPIIMVCPWQLLEIFCLSAIFKADDLFYFHCNSTYFTMGCPFMSMGKSRSLVFWRFSCSNESCFDSYGRVFSFTFGISPHIAPRQRGLYARDNLLSSTTDSWQIHFHFENKSLIPICREA